MANEAKNLQVEEAQKQELAENGAERTRSRIAFVPRVDIYETGDEMVVVADMPGVDEKSVDITLEKNVLTINGYVEPEYQEDYCLRCAEYEVGDYQRSFTLSDKIDQEKIEATVRDGVLRLHLSKAGPARARKITVEAA